VTAAAARPAPLQRSRHRARRVQRAIVPPGVGPGPSSGLGAGGGNAELALAGLAGLLAGLALLQGSAVLWDSQLTRSSVGSAVESLSLKRTLTGEAAFLLALLRFPAYSAWETAMTVSVGSGMAAILTLCALRRAWRRPTCKAMVATPSPRSKD